MDGAAQTINSDSEITFEPATAGYVLSVVYKNIELYNQNPGQLTTVPIPGVIKVSATNCAAHTLTVAMGSQSGTIVCASDTGYVYLKAPLASESLAVSSN